MPGSAAQADPIPTTNPHAQVSKMAFAWPKDQTPSNYYYYYYYRRASPERSQSLAFRTLAHQPKLQNITPLLTPIWVDTPIIGRKKDDFPTPHLG